MKTVEIPHTNLKVSRLFTGACAQRAEETLYAFRTQLSGGWQFTSVTLLFAVLFLPSSAALTGEKHPRSVGQQQEGDSGDAEIQAMRNAEDLNEVLDILRKQLRRDDQTDLLPRLDETHFKKRGLKSLEEADRVFTGKRFEVFKKEARPKLVTILEEGKWVDDAYVELQYHEFLGAKKIPAFSATIIIPTENHNPSGPTSVHNIFPLYIDLQ